MSSTAQEERSEASRGGVRERLNEKEESLFSNLPRVQFLDRNFLPFLKYLIIPYGWRLFHGTTAALIIVF